MKLTNHSPADSTRRTLAGFAITAFLIFASFSLSAQSITGPTEAYIGERKIFYYVDEGADTITWAVSLGTVYSTNHPSQTLYEAAISFEETTGTSFIYVVKNGDTVATHSVVVTTYTPPTPDATFNIVYDCGETTVERTGNLDRQSYSWWWQTAANGTNDSIKDNRLPFITLTSPGNLWLRARLNAPPYTWSTQSQSVGSISINTNVPAAPTQANHSSLIGPGPITVSVGAVSGALSYVWYTEAVGGTPVEGQSTNTYGIGLLDATKTFYVASKTEYCESASRLAVTASILPLPTITVTSANANVILPGQPVVLGTSASYSTYVWKTSDGTVVGSSPSLSVTTAGSYKVTVTANGSPNSVESDPFSVINMISGSVLNGLSFQYRYDHKNRMTHKRVPGADWVYMVYDDRDRLVMTQDGNQRTANRWSYTKYDALNRPVITGIYTHGSSIDQVAMSALISPTNLFETYNGLAATEGYTNTVFPTTGTGALTVTYYDNYDFRSMWQGSYLYEDYNLTESALDTTFTQPDSEFLQVKGRVTGTKVKVLDGGVTGGTTWLKAVTFYDDKYRVVQSLSDNYKGGTDRITNVIDFTGKVLKTKATHLEQDVTWKELIGTSVAGNKLSRTLAGTSWAAGAVSTTQLAASQNGWLEMTVTDVTGNKMIGLADTNPDANYTAIDYCFYLNGSTLRVYENGVSKAVVSGTLAVGDVIRIDRTGTTVTYKKNGTTVYTSATASSTLLMADVSINAVNLTLAGVRASFGSSTRTTVRRFEYDHAARLVSVRHQLEGSNEIILIKNEYNELGQLVDKKLHSADNGSTWKQSVDHRYNIRGWLETINNSKLEGNVPSNDETDDLFGMELKYNTIDTDLSNTALFNGNISGVKWSNYPGTGATKEKGYTYGYDPLNRISSSTYREKATTWSALDNNRFAETGFTYDLNGNILTLTRNDGRPTVDGKMDILAYDYTASGNQLLKVTDGGDDYKGFVDGVNTGNDYTYDANGNMTRDLNKGIGTSLTDNINIITYNFLNLPETVTKGGNSVRYVYDATGRKLSQGVTFAGAVKQTDYAGEYIYENDALQFINHEEGRISIASNTLVYTNPAETTTDFTAVSATLALVTQNGSEKYVRVTSNGTTSRTGVFPIGGTFTVVAGEKYRVRVKAYRGTGNSAAYIQVKAGGADILWPGATIASNAASESWTEQTVTIPTGATTLQVGVNWNTVTAGEILYVNEVEITKLSTTALPEYQYHLKDHLGNVRTTFTSKVSIELPRATVETDSLAKEQTKFLNITRARRVNGQLFDHTFNGVSPSNGAYSTRLTGSTNEKIGLAQSLSVMPGDKIDIEVFAKYVDPGATNDNALVTVLAAIASGGSVPPGTFLDGAGYATASSATYPFTGFLNHNDAGTAPKAYVNYLVFDKNFVYKTGGFKRISTAARETGDLLNHTGLSYEGISHERLAFEGATQIAITEPGYVYVWLSNEETTPVEVYFDDFRVTHTKSPVVQMDDYYPFGLSFYSYSRENSTLNQYFYNSMELQDELNLGWYDYLARQYDPAIGKFLSIDPAADLMRRVSPYVYAFNNPLRYTDPDGMIPEDNTVPETIEQTTTTISFKGNEGEYLIPQGGDLPGTDQIEEVNTATTIWKDNDGNEIGRLSTTTWTSASVDADGEISEVKQRSMSTIETEGHITNVPVENKTIDIKDARESFQNTANSVSEFKKENGRSPVQQEARDNKQLAKNVDLAAGGVGWIATSVAKWAPTPQTKGGAAIVNGVAVLVAAGTHSALPTNPENIKLRFTTRSK